jgi:N6-adenosine-specific RNA methylase IME4
MADNQIDLLPLQDADIELTSTGLILRNGLPYEQWEAIGIALQRLEQSIQFALGDWLNYGDVTYGEKYAQAIEQTEYSYSALTEYAWVSKHVQICSREQNLTFSHHKAVAPCEPEEQVFILNWAAENNASVSATRQKVRELKHQLQHKIQPIPSEVFNLIYADPPWQYNNSGFESSAESHYPTMPLEDICGLVDNNKIQIAPDAVLFLWATNPLLESAFEVINAWGFNYKTNMSWNKGSSGIGGFYVLGRHELLLIATKGSCLPLWTPGSVQEITKSKHSKKPDEFRDIIERMYPDYNYLELFARKQPPRNRWEFWGNEQ